LKKLGFIISRLINILLIFFIIFIILNDYHIIDFSNTLKYILYFLTFILILISATKELILNKSWLSKFINFIILFCSIAGGVFSIQANQINILIYICIISSLIYCFIELVYRRA